jgi:hypothetical protein
LKVADEDNIFKILEIVKEDIEMFLKEKLKESQHPETSWRLSKNLCIENLFGQQSMSVIFHKYVLEGIVYCYENIFRERMRVGSDRELLVSQTFELLYQLHSIIKPKYQKLTKRVFKSISNNPLYKSLDKKHRWREIIKQEDSMKVYKVPTI